MLYVPLFKILLKPKISEMKPKVFVVECSKFSTITSFLEFPVGLENDTGNEICLNLQA